MGKLRIMINTPDIDKPGGVANYYKFLKGKFSDEVFYNYIGGSSKKKLSAAFLLLDYVKFALKIIKIKPDIVHLNPSLDKKSIIRDSIFLRIAKLLGRKVLVSWHGWKENTEQVIDAGKGKKFRGKFGKADAFTVLCSDFKTKLNQWGIEKPIFLETTLFDDHLINGVDISSKELTASFLFLSRIEKAKGIYQAIEAFSLSQIPGKKLYVAGTGSELEQAKKYVKENHIDGIEFTGYVTGKEKSDLFKKCSTYILLSDSEGMPISLLEAMAFGLVVFTTPVGGIKDFFEEGVMGYTVNSNDKINISEKITALYNNKNKLRSISLYNHNYSVEHFKASKVATRIESIYKSIMPDNNEI